MYAEVVDANEVTQRDRDEQEEAKIKAERQVRRLEEMVDKAKRAEQEHHLSLEPMATTQKLNVQRAVALNPEDQSTPSYLSDGFAGFQGVPTAGVSVLELEKLHQVLKRREAELGIQAEKLRVTQTARDALTSEVLDLGERNQELMKAAARCPVLEKRALATKKKNDILLELLGEKSEELEELQGDMEEMKRVFHLNLDQHTPESEGRK